MFAIIRVLIGSYFLAAGTGLILEPSSRTLFDGVLPGQSAIFATTAYLFVTAFMVMTGKLVRPAALLLSIYIFWSAFVHFETVGSPGALAQFWNDMALLGAVLLVAVTEPGGSESFHLWRTGRAVSPRRIKPNGVGLERVTPPVTKPRSQPKPQIEDDEDGDFNIFGDVWDNATAPGFASQRTSNT